MTENRIPWFGARKAALALQKEVQRLNAEGQGLRKQLDELGGLSILELQNRREHLETEILRQRQRLEGERVAAAKAAASLEEQVRAMRKLMVVTEETALLQEAGVYEYRHPLTDAVAYQRELETVSEEMKEMTKKDGGAVLAATNWTVNGSVQEGRKMIRDFSKLMLRAFNAEADNLVRGLKPYKLKSAIDRLEKVASTIEKLGKTMQIRISTPYLQLRERELALTADFLQKQAEEKESERTERERMREERKAQQEMERERAKLNKEKQHYENVLEALTSKGDQEAAERVRLQLQEVERAVADVDYRAANIRAGYVYVISNIGSFGERMVKVGMTRRLDPVDRIRELSDASVPFNFDVHALFFSKDAVGIEQAMHERLTSERVNVVNRRREFFRATPAEVRLHLAELAGELLEFQDVPEALEYRQCLALGHSTNPAGVRAGSVAQ